MKQTAGDVTGGILSGLLHRAGFNALHYERFAVDHELFSGDAYAEIFYRKGYCKEELRINSLRFLY